MRTVFADTAYWIALLSPQDQWHAVVKQVSLGLGIYQLVTTDEVLAEFLNYFAKRGEKVRGEAVALVVKIIGNSNISVLPQSRLSFSRGRDFYGNRLDKSYSLTDCISMQHMFEQGLTEVLTTDHHFEQEGFTILIK